MKKLYSFIFLLLLSQCLRSQEIPHHIIERVTHSTDIFEGTVIRSNSYWNDDHDLIYTSLTLHIMKIFKGYLSCGEVEIIALGGSVLDTSLEVTHNIVLKVAQTGIFMCVETQRELPTIDYFPENNLEKLQVKFNEQGYIQYFDDGINNQV